MRKKQDNLNQEKSEKASTKKTIKNIIEWSVTAVFLFGAFVLVGLNIVQKKNNKPIFGAQFPVVLTDSMDPVYKVKDVLVVKKVDISTIKVDDDITFYWDLTGRGDVYPMTHRVVSIDYFENADENGGFHYNIVTHGINTKSNQCGKPEGCDLTWQKQRFHEDAVIGKVVRKSFFLKALTSVWGLIIMVLAPCLYLMVTIVVDMFKKLEEDEELAVVDSNGSKPNPLAGLSKGEIEELKKEMLEEMLNKGKK